MATATQPTEYDTAAHTAITRMNGFGKTGAAPEKVAHVIYRAANDHSWKQRYPAAGNAGIVLLLRRLLPTRLFCAILRMNIMQK